MRTQAGDAPPPPVGCLLSGILPNFVSFQPSLIIQIHWPSSITMSLPWKLPFSQWKENSPFFICPGDASFFFRSGSHFAFYYTCSVLFSCSVVSDSLRPHEPQHASPPCPSPTSRVYSNWCPLSWWWHPTISSSVIPFSSHLQSFPASGSFQMSQFFT